MADVWAAEGKKRDICNTELKWKVPSGWREGEQAPHGNYPMRSNIPLVVVVIMGLI
jgi:hypothetical protein